MTSLVLGASRIAGATSSATILIVGECNPISSAPEHALYHEPTGCTGYRLQRAILAVRARETYLPMWRTNLCVGGFDRDQAQARAADLVDADLAPWRTVVLLGVKVARAFRVALGLPEMPAMGDPREVRRGGRMFRLACLPHPSGRNYAWNDKMAPERCRDLLRRLEPDVPWGELLPGDGGSSSRLG